MRKKRTLTIELSDEDMERFCKKAGGASLTASRLIENFIADLIGGGRNEWFRRTDVHKPVVLPVRFLCVLGHGLPGLAD